MSASIYYRRWDDRVVEITFEKDKKRNGIYEITNVKWKDDIEYQEAKNACSYSNLRFLLEKDVLQDDADKEDLNLIQITDKNGKKYRFDRCEFEEMVELNSENDTEHPLYVKSVREYMDIIKTYRYLSFCVRIEELALLLKKTKGEENKGCDEESKKQKAVLALGINEQLQKIKELECPNGEVTEMIHQQCNEIIKEIKKKIKEKYNEQKNLIHTKVHTIFREMLRTCDLFLKGENYQYYRGVGHTVYPEMPGALRDNVKEYEDQYYRLAKTKHPGEFANLNYLDRLAKIQHYFWPSRLLDITSNPLVALYMACNTIFTKDDPYQKSYGEVIIYYRDDQQERNYDSKSVLIAAALVKLTYPERKLMYEFIHMHDLYFKYKYEAIGFSDSSLRKVLNFCIHIAADRGCDTILKKEEKAYLLKCISVKSNFFDNCYFPTDYVYRCIHRKIDENKEITIMRHDEKGDQRLRFYCDGEKSAHVKNIKKHRYDCVFNQKVDKKEYDILFANFVAAYDRMMVTIRRENTAFQNKIDIFTMMRSYHVSLGMSNDRILAQSGRFIIAGLDNLYINCKMKSSRTEKLRIIIKDKKSIYEELKLYNINESTMLPDLQHTGEYVRTVLS